MATFTLSGSGTHAITAGTGALHVHVTTLPTIRGAGRAEPTNYYDLGLLRLGDGTYWWPSIPIDAEFQLLGCPQGTLEIAYALFNGTELSVVEVAGANPLAGSRALEDLSDVLIASVADAQVLAWNASAGKWENVTPSAGGGGGAVKILLNTQDTTDRANAASVADGVWTSIGPAYTFTVDVTGALIDVRVNGNFLAGFQTGSVSVNSRVLIDGTTAFRLGGMHAPGSNWGNPLAGAMPIPVSGLATGAHTVTVQWSPNGSVGAWYAQFASDPNRTYMFIRVLQWSPLTV